MKSRFLRTLLLSVFVAAFCVNAVAKDFVLVIDAGHGGKDVGAVGDYAMEKDVNLGVALKFGELVKKHCKNVKVVYTRDADFFVSLQDRANIANKAKGDLFVSIHTNSVDKKSPSRYTVTGSETYTLGLHRSNENLEVAKRENSVIELEDDYSAKYQGFDPNSAESYIIFELNQSKHMEQSINFALYVQGEFKKCGQVDKGVRQAGFWVLAKTGMPAVLVELDFICNPKREKFLSSDDGQEKLAKSLFNAFCQYKEGYDYYKNGRNRDKVEENRTPEKRRTTVAESNRNKVEYRIQFLSSGKRLPLTSRQFKGLKNVEYYEDGGVFKYTTASTFDKRQALQSLAEVQELFEDAFIVEFKNGQRIK